jgi:hypothetical protein
MKTLASLTFTLFLTITAASAGEGKFYSQLIHDTDAAFVLRLPANRFIKITNFTQSVALPSEASGAVYVFQGATGLPGTAAVYANLPGTTREVHEDVYVAGPAVVYVPPLSGAVLLFSYLLGNN